MKKMCNGPVEMRSEEREFKLTKKNQKTFCWVLSLVISLPKVPYEI